MKIALLAFLLALFFPGQAQYLYMKTVTETDGMPEIVKKMSRSTTHLYSRPGLSKTETKMMNTTQTVLFEKEKVTVINPDLCGMFTRAELYNDGLNDAAEYKDVSMVLSNETRQFLGYSCKKAFLTYKMVRSGEYDYETTLWYTDEVPTIKNEELPELTKKNAFTEKIKQLEGLVLYTETLMKTNQVKTIAKVTEVSTKKIDDDDFRIDHKLCKKPLNLEDYKKELKKRERQSNTGFR